MQGSTFYQREMEQMQRSSFAKREEIKEPDEARIKQSVLKGLWFPIFTNLTNLVLEKRKELQDHAFDLLFKLFKQNCTNFNETFWNDILHQIVMPLLEDIHLAVEIPARKQQQAASPSEKGNQKAQNEVEFFMNTTSHLLSSFNGFFSENIDKVHFLIPSYLEVLSVFITKINEVLFLNLVF